MLNSLIGIIASSGGAAGAANSYESIATVTVGGGGASSITFSSIPSTYQHLQVRASMTTTTAALDDTLWQINGDTNAANYFSMHQLRGNGSTASAGANNPGVASVHLMPFNNSTSTFTGGVIDILDYSNTNKYKTFRGLSGGDTNGAGNVFLRSGLWMITSAINSIVITPNGTNFAQYSSFALYGIKG
jgi:hypothetical protein